ncbi:tyrosine-type recombinase/integrase [Vibrio brasiliensis]|uniref:Phage integrase family protein n=1 Tax=Vibrio brasiliensis LMG 20546 TaxID=945543 RepID=E8LYQ2_9VIBR|nr:tyrosine-type recombinase/integrase [Vibrio brasiliensis]EGA64166.1 phage integrase family protein [Vibrio brasiliensis LMG 20546]
MVRKTKNIVKRELSTPDGVVFYSFLSKTTGPIIELEEHVNNMILSSQPYNTVKSKASDLAKFYDYFIEASHVLHSTDYQLEIQKNRALSASQQLRSALTLIFNAYPSYLLDAKESKNALAKLCAHNLDASPLQRTSAKRMISSMCEFVGASNALEHSLRQQKRLDGLLEVDQNLTSVAHELGAMRELSFKERKSLIENSYLASCISGGAKVSKIKNFFRLPPETKSKKEKHFPIEHIGSFLLNTKFHRDRAMYALCFGGGLRMSEATSIRFCDVDVINEEVKLHDKGTISYLENIDYKTVSGKSIEHFTVHLVEPFKSFFFEELRLYLENERPDSESEYIFLQSRGIRNVVSGHFVYQPYYRSSQSTIKDAWESNLKRANLTDEMFKKLKTHSMRHFYAMYMLNFAPSYDRRGIQRFGYTLEEVKHFMRHSALKSTKIYAKEDISKMKRALAQTNNLLKQREVSFYEGMTEASLTNLVSESDCL